MNLKHHSVAAVFSLLTISIALTLVAAAERDEADPLTKPADECGDSNCRVPLCKCSNTKIPNDVPFDDTPMMVGLSFNGVLTTGHAKYLKRILNPVFKNPNDCPIQTTFFVSDKGNGTTDYCFVQGLFNNNNEIAVGSTEYE